MNVNELYHQYLINNNYTSNMLNSISGTDNSENENSIASILNSMEMGSVGGLTGTSGLGSYEVSDLQGIDTTDFQSVLQAYLGKNDTSSVENISIEDFAERLGDVLDEQQNTTSSLSEDSMQTVKDVYEYFQNKAYSLGGLSSVVSSEETSSDTAGQDSAASDTYDTMAGSKQAEVQMAQIEAMFDGNAIEAAIENSIIL